MKYHNEPNNNHGEIQPLMMKMDTNSRGDDDEDTYEPTSHRRRRTQKQRQNTKKFKTYCFAITITCVISGLVAFILAVLHKESEKRNQAADRHHNQKVNQAYSQRADENLQTLFNSQPPTNTEKGCQGTVLIMPSCESKNGVDSCNFVGLERSFYLITLFGRDRRWPVPLDVFVLGSTYKRQRAVETMMPLQVHYQVQNRSEPACYSKRKDLVRDVSLLIMNGTMCGNIVTVTAAFEYEIPLIASDLGCGPLNAGAGCPTVFDGNFDSVWELRFVYDEEGNQGIEDDDDNDDGNGNSGDGDHSGHDLDGLKWRVYGSVVKEKFDPLAFSKIVGDYNGSNSTSEIKVDPRWMNMSLYDHFP